MNIQNGVSLKPQLSVNSLNIVLQDHRAADSPQLHPQLHQERGHSRTSFRGDHTEVQPLSPGQDLRSAGHEDPEPLAELRPTERSGRAPHGGGGGAGGEAGQGPTVGASLGGQHGNIFQVAKQEHQVSCEE